MLKIAVIIGSTRPGRVGGEVARWVYELARRRGDAQFDLIDLREIDLPILDEETPPSLGRYAHDHTKAWAEKVATYDAYLFVTPEYNHGIAAGLKNALDFVYAEWNNKVAGFVGYGSAGGVRAVESLRLVMAELQVATVRSQVQLSLFTDFEQMREFKPASHHEKPLNTMLDQMIAWGGALKQVRDSGAL